jgi:hypothetical protein
VTRLSLILFVCIVMSACSGEEEVEYCKDHHLFHAEHRDELGTLAISMVDDGTLHSILTLPEPTLTEGLDQQLEDVQTVYSLKTERDCAAATPTIRRADGYLIATYESGCGTDNKIGQLDFVLFNTWPSLEEIEVNVVTPVTQKHFAIIRQCESAVFRLD